VFRIEYVLPKFQGSPRSWAWSVKVPTGLYETLTTDDEGRGLYTRKLAITPGGFQLHLTKLLGKDEFFVPENATEEQAILLFENGLEKLGWDQDFIVLLKRV
jgi:hypothetical protein